jgi:hypothetical protein
MVLMPHFIKRARERKIPVQMVIETINNGKKIVNDRNVIFTNKLIDCCMSLRDGAGITIKLHKDFERKVMRDVRKYGTSKNEMVKIYFESLGYVI